MSLWVDVNARWGFLTEYCSSFKTRKKWPFVVNISHCFFFVHYHHRVIYIYGVLYHDANKVTPNFYVFS